MDELTYNIVRKLVNEPEKCNVTFFPSNARFDITIELRGYKFTKSRAGWWIPHSHFTGKQIDRIRKAARHWIAMQIRNS